MDIPGLFKSLLNSTLIYSKKLPVFALSPSLRSGQALKGTGGFFSFHPCLPAFRAGAKKGEKSGFIQSVKVELIFSLVDFRLNFIN